MTPTQTAIIQDLQALENALQEEIAKTICEDGDAIAPARRIAVVLRLLARLETEE
jgi:hypothetical protein